MTTRWHDTSAARLSLTAAAGILTSIAAAVLLLAAAVPALTLIGALLLACVPAGAAVMCWIDTGQAPAQASLTLAVSLALFGLASAGLIWTAEWHPLILLGLAGLSLISCTTRLTVRRPS
jgi:hypothetical protein